jgi:hypothetical protein
MTVHTRNNSMYTHTTSRNYMITLLPERIRLCSVIHIIYIFFTRFFVAEGCSDGSLSGSAALMTLKQKDNLVAYTLLQGEGQKEGQEPE